MGIRYRASVGQSSAFGWKTEVYDGYPITLPRNSNLDINQFANVPVGITPVFSLVSGPSGTSVTSVAGDGTLVADNTVAAAVVDIYVRISDGLPEVAQVVGLAVTQLLPNSVSLVWENLTGEIGYRVQRSLAGANTWFEVGTTAVDVLTFVDSTVLALTSYDYRVCAYDGYGNGVFSSTVAASTPSGSTAGITNPTLVVPRTVLAKPAQGTSYIDPNFGTTITRVTDAVSLGMAVGLGPNYAQQQAWNADETLILLYDDDGFPYIFDAVAPFTRRTVKNGINPPTYPSPGTWKWSPKSTEPRVLYVYSNLGASQNGTFWNGFTPHNGAILIKVSFDTNWTFTHRVVGSWPGYERMLKEPSAEEARLSPAGDVWVSGLLEVVSGGPYRAVGYNVTQSTPSSYVGTPFISIDAAGPAYDTVYGTTYYTNPPYRVPDNVALTPNCDGIGMIWTHEPYAGGTPWFGKELFNMSGVRVKQFDLGPDHGDYVEDASGNQWFISTRSASWKLTRAAVDGPTQVISELMNLPPLPVPTPSVGMHVSGRHTSSPKNWILLNGYSDPTGSWTAMRDELIVVYLDSTVASPHLVRLAQHRSVGTGYQTDMPHATLNRSGTKALFGSNWSDVNGIKDAYMLDIP